VSYSTAWQAEKEFNVKIPGGRGRRPRPPDPRLPQLVERVRAGEPISHVAAVAGIPTWTLAAACHAAGVYPPSGVRSCLHWQPPERYRRVDWTLPDATIARRTGCSREAVRQIRRKMVSRGMAPPTPRRVPQRRAQRASEPSPLPKRDLLARLRRGLTHRNPQQLLVGLCERVKPHADLAARLIRQGRAQDRPYILDGTEVLGVLRGMVGCRRLAAIFALGPLLPIPLDPDLRRQLFRGCLGDVLYSLFCRTNQ
jgi:hypothetical protein